MAVRVTRVIEIEYPDQESYERDRAMWQLPANGTKAFGDKTYRTACLDAVTLGDVNGPEVVLDPQVQTPA